MHSGAAAAVPHTSACTSGELLLQARPSQGFTSWSCSACACSCGCWLHKANRAVNALACVILHAPDIRLCMLQPALGGGQQPVNDQLATGAPVSQQAVQPANQLGTQKPAVTVQNVPAAVAANRLGFTDRDTLPPVSMQCHRGHRLSRHCCKSVTERHIIPAPGTNRSCICTGMQPAMLRTVYC